MLCLLYLFLIFLNICWHWILLISLSMFWFIKWKYIMTITKRNVLLKMSLLFFPSLDCTFSWLLMNRKLGGHSFHFWICFCICSSQVCERLFAVWKWLWLKFSRYRMSHMCEKRNKIKRMTEDQLNFIANKKRFHYNFSDLVGGKKGEKHTKVYRQDGRNTSKSL